MSKVADLLDMDGYHLAVRFDPYEDQLVSNATADLQDETEDWQSLTDEMRERILDVVSNGLEVAYEEVQDWVPAFFRTNTEGFIVGTGFFMALTDLDIREGIEQAGAGLQEARARRQLRNKIEGTKKDLPDDKFLEECIGMFEGGRSLSRVQQARLLEMASANLDD